MAKFSLSALLVLFFSVQSFAQKLIHPLRAGGEFTSVRLATAPKVFPDTVRALAIMVQFRPESTPLTTGTGRFDTSTVPQRIIDAPPHDSAYFADHLLFAKNYFQKASNGQQVLLTTVLGSVVTVSQSMKLYAPLGSNLPLGQLIKEAWTIADSLFQPVPFQDYNLFIIFHAGSGKDIDLRGSIGYDPTPYDIPSLYFSRNGLTSIVHPDSLQLKYHNGFALPNTIILPETENRLLPGAGGDFLYQLSINGLVVANIASYLGLPDLFDTKSGGTAIGRFGLMDGQSIFSFSGLFPPQPSAWEKIFLGWTSPIVVASGSSMLRAPAGGLYPTGKDTIYKIPISAKEYFLVENRNRDAQKNGETLTIRWNRQEFLTTYAKDDDHFNAFNVDSVYGTVVNVDELDWSLPGAIDYLGGILIWHIDETIIEKNLGTNSINADPNHRGVDLEEADGSQDIGQSYGLLDPGSGSENGSPIDYWFSKNLSPVYKNEFSETTNPNSLSNSFAHSHITLDQFSDAGSVMNFRARLGDANISLLKTIKRLNVKLNQNDAPFFADIDGDGSQELIFTSGDSIYVLRNTLTPFLNNSTGLFSPFGGIFQPVLLKKFGSPSDSGNIVGTRDSTVVVFKNQDLNNDGADTLRTTNLGARISTPVVTVFVNGSPAEKVMYVGDVNGNLDEMILSSSNLGLSHRTHIASSSLVAVASTLSESWIAATKDSMRSSSGKSRGFPAKNIIAFSHSKSSSSTGSLGAVLYDDNTFSTFDGSTLEGTGEHRVNGNATGSLAFADVNNDGQTDILIGTDRGLYAYNWNGVIIENFPLKTLDGGKVVGSPIVAKLTGSASVGIIFGSSNGQIYGYDGNGNILKGFPVQTGGLVSSLAFSGNLLAAASTDSSIYVWRLGNIFDSTNIMWKGFLADEYHSNYVVSTSAIASKSTELLPSSFAYNWPNPVYDRTTNIRYYLSKSAAVTIKIYNMAGELIDDFSGPGIANLDNEVQWDVSKVQSGVYFAQIRANAGGEEKTAIIKIAVVK